jgi:group II intron reverse transcriptase/maturase
MVKRDLAGQSARGAAGKGSKRTHFHEGVPYLDSMPWTHRGSDEPRTVRRLHALWNLSRRPHARAQALWRLMDTPELWIAAYKKLAANDGSLTPGGAKGTIDGTSLHGLKALRSAVISGRYRVGISRRVVIPKPKGGRRPLGIPEFRDRLVQTVIKTLLETVFEPRFLDVSHGFRPKRSQHTCLRQVRRDFGGASWIIEGDISQCFDTIDHRVVDALIRRVVDDPRFCRFVYRGMKSRVLMPGGKLLPQSVGTPQGGVCSPLLSNIVLHQLDRYVCRLKRVCDRGERRRRNPAYDVAMNAATYGARSGTLTPNDVRRLRRRARAIGKVLRDDAGFRRLNYVRYADDFLVGVSGPRVLAARVRDALSGFLRRRLRLALNPDKTLLTHLKSQSVRFLGYRLARGPRYATVHVRHYGRVTRRIRAVRGGGIRLLVDMPKVLAGLEHKGYTRGGRPVPNFRYLHQSQTHAVIRANSILRGLGEYYKLSEGRRTCLNQISYIVRSSLAKLFAAKFKLRSSAQVYRHGGKDLSKPLSSGARSRRDSPTARQDDGSRSGPAKPPVGIGVLYTVYRDIPVPDTAPLARVWHPWRGHESALPWPISRWSGFSVRGGLALGAPCAMCEHTHGVEMHHVRALKHIRGKTPVELAMMAARRKQIPLCRRCHLQAHGQSSHR